MRLALAQRGERGALELPRLAGRLRRALAAQLQAHQLRLSAATQRLQAHDPQRVLRRGYAWVESADGRPVTSAASLQPGQAIRTVWADGRALAVVTSVELPPA